MKKLVFLLLLVVVAAQVFGQKKKKQSEEEIRIDSLTTAVSTLTLQLDSVSGQLDSVSKDYTKYFSVYTVVRDSVIKYNFDPSKTTALIDSLKTSRNSAFAEVNAVTGSLKDSISLLLANKGKLQIIIDSLSVKKEVDITKMAADLKVLKELLDSKTLTQAEFDMQKNAILEKYKL